MLSMADRGVPPAPQRSEKAIVDKHILTSQEQTLCFSIQKECGFKVLESTCAPGAWAALMRGTSSAWEDSCMYSGSRVRAAASSHASVASRMGRLCDINRSTALLTGLALLLAPCNASVTPLRSRTPLPQSLI